MKFDPSSNRVARRLLSPRIFVYAAIALAVAWILQRYGHYRQNMPSPGAGIASEVRLTQPPELAGLPMIVVIPSPGQDLEGMVAQAQEQLKGSCHVIMLTVADAEATMKLFKLEKLPAALKYDAANREIGRLEGDVTGEGLSRLGR